MTASIKRARAIVLSSLAALMAATAPMTGADGTPLRVGTGKANITPETLSPDSRMKGVHDEMFVRAIAFDDGETKALLIASETMGVRNDLWDEMSARIHAETGVDPQHILLCAVHTHSGPPMDAFYKDRMMAAVKEALGNLQPAQLGAGKGECKMNMSRRAPAATGGYWLGKNPYAPCDHEIGVLRIDDLQDSPFAVMVNWPAHAVVNWPQPKFHSGDWPGATSRFLEERWGGKVSIPVTVGASGDVNPLYWAPYLGDDKFDSEATDRNTKIDILQATAMDLGERAAQVAEGIVTHPGGKISGANRVLVLPGKKRFPNRMPGHTIERGDDLHVRLSVLKVGDVVFAGFGGEVMTEIGMHLKERSPYRHTFVVTHCNGSCGYLVTDEALQQGGYEPSGSKSMPGCEKALVATMLEMIDAL